MDMRDALLKYRYEGDFVLSGGIASKVYYDVRSALLEPHVVDEWNEWLSFYVLDLPPSDCVVAGISLGGALLVGSQLTASMGDPPHGLVKRTDGKAHGWGGRGWLGDVREVADGKHVLLMDDVMTTGKTLMEASAELRRYGAEEVTCAVVLDRSTAHGVHVRFEVHAMFTEEELA